MSIASTLKTLLSPTAGARRPDDYPGPIPFQARHVQYSAIASADDDVAKPSDRLIDIAIRSADKAKSVTLDGVVGRMGVAPYYPNVWPGEHYKLLAALVSVLRPKSVIEIGTSTGLSALSILTALPPDSTLTTFDIFPWQSIPDTYLTDADFADGRLNAVVGDVSVADVMNRHAALFRSSDLIFADGPKDGVFEDAFLRKLAELGLTQNPIVLLDDIRVWNMLNLWRTTSYPKLDITSFGHWSGTGLIDWSPPE